MEGGRDPFGSLRDTRGRIERCRTLKAPSSRAILGGRCGRRPPTLRGSVVDARGPRAARGDSQLEPWWCTPTTSGSRASRGRRRRQRRLRSLTRTASLPSEHSAPWRIASGPAARRSPSRVARERRLARRNRRRRPVFGPANGEWRRQRGNRSETTCAGFRVAEERAGSAFGAPPSRAERREQPAGPAPRPTAAFGSHDGGTGRLVGGPTSRLARAESASQWIESDPPPMRSPFAGAARTWQLAGQSLSSDGGLRAARRREGTASGRTRLETTRAGCVAEDRAGSASRAWLLSGSDAEEAPRRPELLVRRWSSDRSTASGDGGE
jgi:hypothetical protein